MPTLQADDAGITAGITPTIVIFFCFLEGEERIGETLNKEEVVSAVKAAGFEIEEKKGLFSF